MTLLLRGFAAGALLGVLATAASAQAPGLPVHGAGVPSGLVVAGHAAFLNDAAGSGRAYGVSGGVGTGVIGGTATLAFTDPAGELDGTTAVGANVGVRVLGGPFVPVAATVVAGVGYTSQDSPPLVPLAIRRGAVVHAVAGPDILELGGSVLHVPVGVSVALSVPSPAFSLRPWIMPRIDIARFSPSGGDPETVTDFAVSAGLELSTISGFGVHAAYDWIARDGDKPGILDVGLHYAFRVPGL